MLCMALLTRESHSSISRSFGGRVGGSQMITLDHKGEGGVWKGPKYDPAILEWPRIQGSINLFQIDMYPFFTCRP